MKPATAFIRIILGIMMLTFGLNGFLQFLPGSPVGEKLGAFFGALAATKYMPLMISSVNTIAGALLVLNLFSPIVLIVLFTVLINAFFAHLFLDPPGIAIAAFTISLNVFLLFAYKEKYVELVRNKRKLTY